MYKNGCSSQLVSQSVSRLLSSLARPLALALSRRENESPSRINGVLSRPRSSAPIFLL